MFNVQLSARLGEILGTKCATVVGQQSIDVHPERLVIGHDFARDYSLDGAVALTYIPHIAGRIGIELPAGWPG